MIIKEPLNSHRLPEYHEGQLMLKMRPGATDMGIFGSNISSLDPFSTPGMSALSFLENAGLIKRVIPLAATIPTEDVPIGAMSFGESLSVMSILAASSRSSDTVDPNAGVSILELQRDEDVAELQMALVHDPTVEFVARVPIRYLQAPRKKQSPREDDDRDTDISEESHRDSGAVITAVPPPASTMWNLTKIQWHQARAIPNIRDANNIKVAILDSGIEPNHPDLAGRVARYLFNYTGIPSASGDLDLIGHGTHVAGTVAATIGNNVGINGICTCQLHAYKIFDDIPDYDRFNRRFVYYVDPPMYIRALAECIQQRVNVVNLSIGGPGVPSPQERTLFNTLLTNGTTVVAAMGNERQLGNPISYPAAIPGVIAVGSSNIDDTVANHSNRGNHISIVAPGVSIWSTLPTYPGQVGYSAVPGPNGLPVIGAPIKRDTSYDAWDGTSMASPHVSAAAALLLANKGHMSPADVRNRLMQAADRVTGMNGLAHHPDFGAGRLNLLRLLQ